MYSLKSVMLLKLLSYTLIEYTIGNAFEVNIACQIVVLWFPSRRTILLKQCSGSTNMHNLST